MYGVFAESFDTYYNTDVISSGKSFVGYTDNYDTALKFKEKYDNGSTSITIEEIKEIKE